MAAFLGALLGRHLAHTEDQRQIAKTIFLTKTMGKIKDPTDPNITTEDANQGLQMGMEYGIVDKRTGNVLKGNLAAAQKKWDAAEEGRRVQRDAANAPPAPGSQGTPLGTPNMNPATAPPVTPQPPQPQLPPPPTFNAAGGGGLINNAPPPGLAAPYQTPPSPDNSAILQRLLPALLAARAQGGMQNTMGGGPMVPGTTPPSLAQGSAPGIPQNGGQAFPPANGGAGAGPTPPAQGQPGENPQMVLGAAKGGTGFNVMPPADMPGARIVPPAPPQYNFAPPPADAGTPAPTAPPPAPAQARPTGLFPYRNSPTLEQVAAIKGRAAAAEALPTAEQANTLALKQEAATYQQKRSQQLAEQEYMLTALRNSPDYKSAAPLQRLEMELRIRGMQGAINQPLRQVILPKSAIPNSEFPEGTLDNFGRELDRTPGKWSNMQSDPNTGEIRAAPTTPVTTKTKLVLQDGRSVIAVTDPRGTLLNVVKDVDGSPITDPALWETVRSTLATRTITTVGKDGKPVTVVEQFPTPSTSQKVPPGRRPAATGPGASTGTGGGTGTGASAGGGGRIIQALPKPLTAATQKASEYAQTIQNHIPRIKELMDSLDRTGDLGVIAGRWNDFMTGKLGGKPGGGTDPRYAQLRANMGMFDTALGVAHQVKGVKMMDHFKELADAGKMDYPTLKGSIGELESWVNSYADMGKNRQGAVDAGGGPMNNPPAKTPGGPDDLLNNLIKQYK